MLATAFPPENEMTNLIIIFPPFARQKQIIAGATSWPRPTTNIIKIMVIKPYYLIPRIMSRFHHLLLLLCLDEEGNKKA